MYNVEQWHPVDRVWVRRWATDKPLWFVAADMRAQVRFGACRVGQLRLNLPVVS